MHPFSVVETFTEGQYFDVVILDASDTLGGELCAMQRQFREQHRKIIHCLLSEPRARPEKNLVFLLKATHRGDKHTLFFMRDGIFVPISVSGILSAANILTQAPGIGRPRPARPATPYSFATIAGDVDVDASFKPDIDQRSPCDVMTVYNVPSFVFKLSFSLNVPGLGSISADVAYGGMICAFVDAASVGLTLTNEQRPKLAKMGDRIRRAIRARYTPVHPLDAMISGISTVVFTQGIVARSQWLETLSAAFVVPGRLETRPSGTVTSAWLAVLHARRSIGDESLMSRSLAGPAYYGRIIGETAVGVYQAVLPMIKGRSCVTAMKHAAEPSQPFGVWADEERSERSDSPVAMVSEEMENLENLRLPQQDTIPRETLQERIEEPQEPPEEPQCYPKEQQGPSEEEQEQEETPRQCNYSEEIVSQETMNENCMCWGCIAHAIENRPYMYGLLLMLGGGWVLDACLCYLGRFCGPVVALEWGRYWRIDTFQF
ncbi:proline racemase A precursor [Penicillium capsulatum]|uniref:Proline racemase A n=1 Tax=Penicillium capsulatum TaxID=69766 RepID=A0A9W9IM25_9EURO|nr:proline racemase A precursor [Penicillium capsulatum]KAJ6121940.1 proline racemase A precursor [Penicillium capsulatum]